MSENDTHLPNLRARAFCVAQEMDDWRRWSADDAELAAEVATIAAALKRIRDGVTSRQFRKDEHQEATG